MPTSSPRTCVSFLLTSWLASAQALAASPAAPGPPTTNVAWDSQHSPLAPPPPFEWGRHGGGLRLMGGIGTATAGDWLMFELGGEHRGWSTLAERAWIAHWDGWLVARAGELANEHPFMFLAGGRQRLAGDLGRRFTREAPWSPYLGLGAHEELRWLWHPGLAPSKLDTVNNVDGVAGLGANASVRAQAGLSFAGPRGELLLAGFLGVHLQRAELNLPSFAFTTLGLSLRLNTRRGLTVEGDGFWGATAARRNEAQGLSDRTTRIHVDGLLRQAVSRTVWLSVASSWTRDADRLVFDAGGAPMLTHDAPTFTVTVAGGILLGGTR